MVPPYSIDELKRKVSGNDPLKIFLLYEGANTERYLINPLLSSNIIVASRNIVFKPIKKEDNDAGITDPFSLLRYANDIIHNEIKKKNFISGRDKMMIVFDLDVLKNDQNKMNKEMMEVYKKENLSPFSGCLSSIIQIVLLMP